MDKIKKQEVAFIVHFIQLSQSKEFKEMFHFIAMHALKSGKRLRVYMTMLHQKLKIN